jgi:hypothetical protein
MQEDKRKADFKRLGKVVMFIIILIIITQQGIADNPQKNKNVGIPAPSLFLSFPLATLVIKMEQKVVSGLHDILPLQLFHHFFDE